MMPARDDSGRPGIDEPTPFSATGGSARGGIPLLGGEPTPFIPLLGGDRGGFGIHHSAIAIRH